MIYAIRVLEHLISLVPRSRLRFWCVYARGPDVNSAPHVEPYEEVSFREATNVDWGILMELNTTLSLRDIEERANHHNTCFLAFRGPQPAAYQWVILNETVDPVHLNQLTNMRVDLILPAKCYYVWDAFTRPIWRRRGIHSSMTDWIARKNEREGIRTGYAVIEVTNKVSRKSYRKSGFQHLTTLVHLQVLGKDLVLGSHTPKNEDD